jgi:hypothetical protein
MGRPFIRMLVLFHSTDLIPTGSRYTSSIPHCCADNLTCASNSHYIPCPQNECILFYIFSELDVFKDFKHCEMKIYGEVEVKIHLLTVVLDEGDLWPLLSSHHIPAEEIPTPGSIE